MTWHFFVVCDAVEGVAMQRRLLGRTVVVAGEIYLVNKLLWFSLRCVYVLNVLFCDGLWGSLCGFAVMYHE